MTTGADDKPVTPDETPAAEPVELADELRDSRLRAPILRVLFLTFSMVGLVASVMLTQLHVKAHTRPNATSFCSVHSKVDCLSVAESPWAVLWGVPVSVWSIVFYAVLILGMLAVFVVQFRQQSRRRRGEKGAEGEKGEKGADGEKGEKGEKGAQGERVWHSMPGVMFVLAAEAFLGALVMAYISHFLVKSLCLVCAALYLVNTVLLVVSWLVCRAHGGVGVSVRRDVALWKRNPVRVAWAGLVMVVIAGVLMAAYPNYWRLNEPVGPGNLPHGMTQDGHAWIGAKNPALTIHEFSDYQCGFCRNFNARLRTILNKKKFRDRVRLVHHHYPLDHLCNPSVKQKIHSRACELARGAICAAEQGKFWHMNDMMFRRQRRRGGPNLQGLAAKLKLDIPRFEKCLRSDRAKKKLVQDMALGDRMSKECIGEGIPGTPYYVFERPGEELQRGHPYEKVIERELKTVVYPRGAEGVDHGLTQDGHPWIGARNPRLTIYELSDYECYFCMRHHATLRQLLKRHKDLREDVRLVHLQYPLGHQCNPTVKRPQHKRACVMARAALCAREQGRFWEMNDALYRNYSKRRPPNVVRVARTAGLDMARFGRCLNIHATAMKLQREILYGEKLGQRDGDGVSGAPAFFFQPLGKPFGRAFAPNEKSIRNALKSVGPRPRPAPPEVPAMGPDGTPAMTPGMTPAMTPGVAPAMTPGVAPAMTPGVAPAMAPGETPGMAAPKRPPAAMKPR